MPKGAGRKNRQRNTTDRIKKTIGKHNRGDRSGEVKEERNIQHNILSALPPAASANFLRTLLPNKFTDGLNLHRLSAESSTFEQRTNTETFHKDGSRFAKGSVGEEFRRTSHASVESPIIDKQP